jgi:hypothetical protein
MFLAFNNLPTAQRIAKSKRAKIMTGYGLDD